MSLAGDGCVRCQLLPTCDAKMLLVPRPSSFYSSVVPFVRSPLHYISNYNDHHCCCSGGGICCSEIGEEKGGEPEHGSRRLRQSRGQRFVTCEPRRIWRCTCCCGSYDAPLVTPLLVSVSVCLFLVFIILEPWESHFAELKAVRVRVLKRYND